MRQLVVTEFITLDGVTEAPCPAHDFKRAFKSGVVLQCYRPARAAA